MQASKFSAAISLLVNDTSHGIFILTNMFGRLGLFKNNLNNFVMNNYREKKIQKIIAINWIFTAGKNNMCSY